MTDATNNTTNPVPSADITGQKTGTESSLSSWAGPYVTDMLGRGAALANEDYFAFEGPLSAGASDLQNQAFQGVAGLALPDQVGQFQQQSFTDPGVAGQYMNPFLQQALQPQIDELRRQNQINQQNTRGQLTKAGAYGGGRQAIMEAELQRNLLDEISQVTGQGFRDAYDRGASQFNTEQNLAFQASDQGNQLAQDIINLQANLGGTQRDITQQGIDRDIAQFEEEREYPYKQVQFMQSLLDGMPLTAQNINFAQASDLGNFLQTSGSINGFLEGLFGSNNTTTPQEDTTNAGFEALINFN